MRIPKTRKNLKLSREVLELSNELLKTPTTIEYGWNIPEQRMVYYYTHQTGLGGSISHCAFTLKDAIKGLISSLEESIKFNNDRAIEDEITKEEHNKMMARVDKRVKQAKLYR